MGKYELTEPYKKEENKHDNYVYIKCRTGVL